jgi:hypothetical protein
MEQSNVIYLLSIPGRLAPETLEAALSVHNTTAGDPANVAAAKSLGDLSHMVYVPAGHPDSGASNFLILDLWNNLDGLNSFFANKQVQEQAGEIFSQRDPVVWAPAEGFHGYHLPAPFGKNERIVGLVRGMVHSRAEAQNKHNTLVAGSINKARAAGNLSHEAYFRLTPPGAPESLEFFAVDVWMSASGMGQYYDNPEFIKGFQELFATPPATSVWVHPAGDWVEW